MKTSLTSVSESARSSFGIKRPFLVLVSKSKFHVACPQLDDIVTGLLKLSKVRVILRQICGGRGSRQALISKSDRDNVLVFLIEALRRHLMNSTVNIIPYHGTCM